MAISMGGGGFVMPGAYQGGGRPAPPVQQMPPEYLAQLREQNRIKKMVAAYESNPGAYTEDKALQIQQLATEAGIPFEPQSNPGARWKKGLLAAIDSAAFGLLPIDEMYKPVNAAERKAVQWGKMAGMVLPWGAPGRLAMGVGNIARGFNAAKGVKGLKDVSTAQRFWAGATNVNPMLKTSKMFGGSGAPIGANIAKETVKTAAKGGGGGVKVISKKVLNDKSKEGNREFFKYFQNIISTGGTGGKAVKSGSGKGFWSSVNKGKTLDEQVNMGLAWMKQNLPKGTLNQIKTDRLRGTVRGLITNPKAPKRYRGVPKKEPLALPAHTPGINTPKAAATTTKSPTDLIKVSSNQIAKNAAQKLAKSTTTTKKMPGGTKVNVGQIISNSLKRTLKSGKKLSKANIRQIMARMPQQLRQGINKLPSNQKAKAVKEWARNNLLNVAT
jgi:hypothetical protein